LTEPPRPPALSEQRLRDVAASVLAAADAAGFAFVLSAESADGPRGLYVSPTVETILGYTAEEMMRVPLMGLLAPDELPRLAALREKRLAGEPVPMSFETVSIHKNGSRVPLEVAIGHLEIEGRPATVSFFRDASATRRDRAALVQADRLATVGALAAGVAHEINNPLGYVLLNLGFLQKELPRIIDDPTTLGRVLRMVEAASEGTQRVATIVRDLRAVSRWDGDARGPIDVRAVADSAINIAGNEIRRRARLVRDYRDVPLVVANDARLGQVFLNLLLNAAQSIPDDDGREHTVTVRIGTAPRDRVLVEVVDDGVGMTADVQRRIFDPFFTMKPPGLGTGLGLSICQNIVASLSGELTCTSEPGRGSTFRVELPGFGGPSAAVDAFGPKKASQPRYVERLRVLVVDDEERLAQTLAQALATEHDVVAVTSGADAIERLHAEAFDVVLCDVLMPAIDGEKIYDHLREHAPGLERRIVFMTGGDTIPRVQAFLARVPNPKLLKPFDPAAALDVIAGVRALTPLAGIDRASIEPGS
jgi:PAS domain S-box-containing protein